MKVTFNKLVSGAAVAALSLPMVAFAATDNPLQTALTNVGQLVATALPIVLSLVILYFMWGVAKYVLKIGGEEGQKAAKDIMIWGIIAIAVIVSMWGLVAALQSFFGVSGTAGPTDIRIPTVTQ